MSNTIRVASRLPMALRIVEKPSNPEKPGEGPDLRTLVINGSATSIGSNEGVTDDVDAGFFRQWMKDNPHHPAVASGAVREIGDDEDLNSPAMFGFQPGLEGLGEDGDNNEKAAEGSDVKDAGPVPAAKMDATSKAPNDDSPRSQTPLNAGGVAAPAVAVKK